MPRGRLYAPARNLRLIYERGLGSDNYPEPPLYPELRQTVFSAHAPPGLRLMACGFNDKGPARALRRLPP